MKSDINMPWEWKKTVRKSAPRVPDSLNNKNMQEKILFISSLVFSTIYFYMHVWVIQRKLDMNGLIANFQAYLWYISLS